MKVTVGGEGHCCSFQLVLIDENCSRLALDVLVASHHSCVWIHSSSLSCEFQPGECRLYSVLLTCVGCRCHCWSNMVREGCISNHFEHSRNIRPWHSGNPWRHTSMGKAGRTIFFPKKTLQVWPVAFRGVFVSAFSTDDETKVVHFHPGWVQHVSRFFTSPFKVGETDDHWNWWSS